MVPYRGPVNATVLDVLGGLRSTCTCASRLLPLAARASSRAPRAPRAHARGLFARFSETGSGLRDARARSLSIARASALALAQVRRRVAAQGAAAPHDVRARDAAAQRGLRPGAEAARRARAHGDRGAARRAAERGRGEARADRLRATHSRRRKGRGCGRRGWRSMPRQSRAGAMRAQGGRPGSRRQRILALDEGLASTYYPAFAFDRRVLERLGRGGRRGAPSSS